MVYYLTSTNVKLMRNIAEDFAQCQYCTAYEYMKTYIEQCPDCVNEDKLRWIAETFLGIHKHGKFIRELTATMSKGLSDKDNDYLVILLYGIIFQIPPEEKENVYKCAFNLSKEMLQRFASFFSNNEILPFVSQLACGHYDSIFVTEKIISPLFLWQPYISEIYHDFETYMKRISRRVKSPTVPSEMSILNRPTKARKPQRSPVTHSTNYKPPKKIRMLTKSDIDQRLKLLSKENKMKATQLLNEMRQQNFSFAKDKSDKYYKTIAAIQNDMEKSTRPATTYRKPHIPKLGAVVKDNVTSIKRMGKTVAKSEKEEIQWMHDIMKCCSNTAQIDQLDEDGRNKKEIDRQIAMEKNHLKVQLSYEEAILAKQKVLDDKKKKYDNFIKEKEIWIEKIEKWKKEETEKNKKIVEEMSLLELEMLEAKNNLNIKKKNIAQNVKEKSKCLLAMALEEKNNELQRRVNMIKEIKVLAIFARQAKLPKIIDLTESSGLGLMCEMSIAELQERLAGMKIQLKEELEMKKENIKSDRDVAKHELEETKNMIKEFLHDKSTRRMKKSSRNSEGSGDMALKTNKEILELKKTLEEKRNHRLKNSAAKHN